MSGYGYCYDFGRAIAHFDRERFDLRRVIQMGNVIALSVRCGSNGERDAMLGAFDEYRRLLRCGMKVADEVEAVAGGAAEESPAGPGKDFRLAEVARAAVNWRQHRGNARNEEVAADLLDEAVRALQPGDVP